MLSQFFSLTVGMELVIALAWGVAIWFASRYYGSFVTKPMKFKADYLKAPTSNALTVLGLVVPILVALTSYLYSNRPTANYGSLLATIVLYFMVLIVAIWETFSLLQKAQTDDTIELIYPQDRVYVTGLGLMYGMLVLGLLFFAYFFLFEIRPAEAVANSAGTLSALRPMEAVYLVERPLLQVDETKADVLRLWGQPSRASANTAEYDLDRSVLRIAFDKNERIEQLSVVRR